MIIFMRYEKIDAIFNQFHISHYRSQVEQILDLESIYHKLANPEFLTITAALKQKLRDGAAEEDIKIHAFALIREAACRVLGMRPFPVQVLGGLVLNDGCVAEMKTGEGKTLVAIMPAYLNALSGKGVFVVTVNDYLAKRDAEQMGRVFAFAGLTTGLVTSGMSTAERKAAYQCDITYGTSSEFGFDYLRDNIAADLDDQVQPRRHFAIIDEADSILIDEARTPLIISGDQTRDAGEYERADRFIKSLTPADYEKEEKEKVITLTESGIAKAEAFYHLDNLAAAENTTVVHDIEKALYANGMMDNGVDYIVQDGKVVIVDQYTGRVMPSRQFSDGLHQAIEAKEGVTINSETKTLATITIQNYFRHFDKIAGMTGTAQTVADEFRTVYHMDVVSIPTNVPVQRVDKPDQIYTTESAKLRAVTAHVKACLKKGQPVLIGTASVNASEKLSAALTRAGIPHTVLNAKHLEQEAAIIAKAGQRGAVTISTNMAGRGTDIKLGPGVREAGGLCVIGTERHESERVDNQLRGRAGRQGDPGVSQFYLSLEDNLLKIFGGPRAEKLIAKYADYPKDKPIVGGAAERAVKAAQDLIEAKNADQRKNVLKYDDIISRQRDLIYKERQAVLESGSLAGQIDAMADDAADAIIDECVTDDYKVDTQQFIQKLKAYNIAIPQNELVQIRDLDTLKQALVAKFKALHADHVAEFGETLANNMERLVLLRQVDAAWIDHLTATSQLRQGIGLRAYGQNDPVVEYSRESGELFDAMNRRIVLETVKALANLTNY
ncbi:MAG: preprotein translocase subunit SecA [Pseudoramibacter sp. EUB1.1]|uniref:Protein translocase subunit SecA n=1 Tax=Candidatus Pseudoramibacter fermentans TaxID=2594427 RepID=A0A6L5GSP9_9FIRM|nr:preprotein translocase subunit SecA [Candidatus Pseudoramibacter fermentans]